MTNPYCEALGISVPDLSAAARSARANTYSLLIVVLLERGEPVTLAEAARRFEEAGVAPAPHALASLKRCKPARPPVYRDGDLYALDPHDDEADLWAFRLGLRPPRTSPVRIVRPPPKPLPEPDEPLTLEELDEAWRDGIPSSFSALRIATCVLDAHGRSMRPEEVVTFVAARSRWSVLRPDSATWWRRGSPVQVLDDGSWKLDPRHDAVLASRNAVRERIVDIRRWAERQPDPVMIEVNRKRFEREREANAARLAKMRRVLIRAFPAKAPEAVVLVDVDRHELSTFIGGEIERVNEALESYDIIATIDVRALLRTFGFDPGARRLAELGPPQKTIQLNRRGRTLRITTSLLVQGSCGISRPFGDEKILRGYLRNGELQKLRRRLEADAKSLYALYQYGRLHGAVRLRWGFLDERIPAPWVHLDEMKLYELMRRACDRQVPLEVIVGSAPGWADPWSRVRRAHVRDDASRWKLWLVDDEGFPIDEDDVQLARVSGNPLPAP